MTPGNHGVNEIARQAQAGRAQSILFVKNVESARTKSQKVVERENGRASGQLRTGFGLA